MHPDLEKLKSLQEVDRQIQRLNEEIGALPRRVAAIEGKLAAHKAEVERHKNALKENELSRRKFEHEIQGEQQKISKYRDQSLEVKTNEQYKALMHEIEFAQQSIRAAEDRILQAMVDAEGHEKAIKSAEAELKAESAEVEKEKAETRARTEQDEKELAEWSAQRRQLRGGITPETLAHYDRVLTVRKTALAEAREQHCMACNVMLRPQKYDEIRSNQHIMTCDSCNRILYYDPANEPAPPAEKPKKKKKPQPAETQEAEIAAPSEV
jgi:predicted  nucleic acid-binding Zn-ribbon protein